MKLRIFVTIISLSISHVLAHELRNSTTEDSGTRIHESDEELAENGTTYIEHRMRGGEETTIEKFPWMAGVYIEEHSTVRFIGGASIITDEHLLTAAHVLIRRYLEEGNGRKLVVLMGSEYMYEGKRFEIKKIYVHPKYANHKKHDIGIIQLATRIDFFTEAMEPVSLPDETHEYEDFEGRKLTVIGWGSISNQEPTEVLMKAKIPIIPIEICREWIHVDEKIYPAEKFVCGGAHRQGTCHGDSGGPLMTKKGGEYTIVGIVTFGITDKDNKCGIPGAPSYFLKVAPYLKWINHVISGYQY